MKYLNYWLGPLLVLLILCTSLMFLLIDAYGWRL